MSMIKEMESTIQSLQSLDPKVRVRAARRKLHRLVGKYKDKPQIIETAFLPFVEALKDSHEKVRMNAARSLGEIGNPEAVPPLIQALDDPSEWVLYHVADSLEKFKDSRALAPLLAKMDDGKALSRERIIYSIGILREQGSLPRLIEALEKELDMDGDDGVIRSLMDAISGIPDAGGLSILIRHLSDDSQVADIAANALENAFQDGRFDARVCDGLRENGAVGLLIKALGSKRYGPGYSLKKGVVGTAASILGELKDPIAVPALIKVLRSRKDHTASCSAAMALGRIGDMRAFGPITAAIKNRELKVKLGGIEALGGLGLKDSSAADHLLGIYLKTTEKCIRVKAHDTLIAMNGSVVNNVAGTLRSESAIFRNAAFGLLLELAESAEIDLRVVADSLTCLVKQSKKGAKTPDDEVQMDEMRDEALRMYRGISEKVATFKSKNMMEGGVILEGETVKKPKNPSAELFRKGRVSNG